jgi:hypothetical protein
MRNTIALFVLFAVTADFCYGEGNVAVCESLSPVVRETEPSVPSDIVATVLPSAEKVDSGFDTFVEHTNKDEYGLVDFFPEKECPKFALLLQKVLLAWNGKIDTKGEILVIRSATMSSKNGSGAVLGIIPLPGKPISIERFDAKIFEDSRKILKAKWNAEQGTGSTKIEYKTDAVISLFVLKFDSVDDFIEGINAYLSKMLQKDTAIEWDAQYTAIIEQYLQRGFRYFAFDVSELTNGKIRNKETIMFRCQSKAGFYPLLINQVGGKGDTSVDFIIMTPDKIKTSSYEPMNNYDGIDVQINGGGAVVLTKNEILSLSPLLGKFFDGTEKVNIRNLLMSGDMSRFYQDLIFK